MRFARRVAGREQVERSYLRGETLELWPHEMAPGYYDAVMAACRTAGFEPRIDQDGADSIVRAIERSFESAKGKLGQT